MKMSAKPDQAPYWQRITARLMALLLLFQISFPLYANVKTAKDLERIEDSVTNYPGYIASALAKKTVYESIFEKSEIQVFDGFKYFFEGLRSQDINAFPQKRIVPVLMGGITIPIMTVVEDYLPDRFGTAAVERGIIKGQINQLLNKSWITGYESYNEQAEKLYDNALRMAKNHGFLFGQNLTAEQISKLTDDVVWPEIREINGQQVIVPFVYLTASTIASNKIDSSTLSARNINIETDEFIVNGASVEARKKALFDVKNNFIVKKGSVTSDELKIKAGGSIENLSGEISGREVSLIANKLVNNTLLIRHDFGHGVSEGFDRIAKISALGSLNINTAGDVISHGGSFSAGDDIKIQAGGNIQLLTQEARYERNQSGRGWTDNESSLVNLQTGLAAVDVLSLIADGQIIIKGANLESKGVIELLANYGLHIFEATDMESYSRTFESKTGGIFGTNESESEKEMLTKVVRTLIKAGKGVRIRSTIGDITLRAVRIQDGGVTSIIAQNGGLNIPIAKELEQYDYKQSYEDVFAFRYQGKGYFRETAIYSEFRNEGGLFINAANGIRVEYDGKDDINTTIDALSKAPGMQWMQELRDHPDTDWQAVELAMEEWDYDQKGLTKAAAALIAIAVSIAIGPYAETLSQAIASSFPSVGPAAQAALSKALTVGMETMANQAINISYSNNFNLLDTLDQMSSSENIRNLAESMAKSGAITGFDGGSFFDTTGGNWVAQAANAVLNAAIRAGVSTIIEGGSSKDFQDNFIQAVAQDAVNVLGRKLANKIHDAKSENLGGDYSVAIKYISHAALGCGLAAATSAINGGDSDENELGCYSGAAGAVIGEYVAEKYSEDVPQTDKEVQDFVKEIKKVADDENWSEEERKEQIPKLQAEMESLKQKGVDIGRLTAGITVLLLGGDVNSADLAARNAAENNFFFLIPILVKGFSALLVLYNGYETIRDIHELYVAVRDKNEQKLRAALASLVVGFLGAKALEKGFDVLKILSKDHPLFIEMTTRMHALGLSMHADYFHQLAYAAPNGQFRNDVDVSEAVSRTENLVAREASKHSPDYLKYKDEVPGTRVSQKRFDELSEYGYFDYDSKPRRWKSKEPNKTKNYDVTADPVELDRVPHGSLDLSGITFTTKVDGKLYKVSYSDAVQRRKEAVNASEKHGDEDGSHLKMMRAMSEAIGEIKAEAWAKGKLSNANPLVTGINDGKSGRIDQIYSYERDGEIRIAFVEAKGGVSPSYSSSQNVKDPKSKYYRQDVQQGTDPYKDEMIFRMQQSLESALDSPRYKSGAVEDRDFVAQANGLRDTLKLVKSNRNKIDYYGVKQTIDRSTGEPVGYAKIEQLGGGIEKNG
ncbi:DUF637 domain-containing protein [Endozoicomonas arenosclerae]|uniref:DUF637 domain-containing protein n=1 Tax=Endozoicomonas arenosclerae TaxID=1633495 RepID=UPI00078289F2|nr:DUF637 domain-containing protein [Endozoicomonas arenosclerae]